MVIDEGVRETVIEVGTLRLKALLGMPDHPKATIIFAHGSGSGRLSPRNNQVARVLRRHGFATLLLDLLTPQEESIRANVFDIALLARRLLFAADWVERHPLLGRLPIGLFGASTGAGAALVAAAHADHRVGAIVSRGGRPDLAGDRLPMVSEPTQLIVGGLDGPVIDLNRYALDRLGGEKEMVIVPGAGHLFEEPGTLDQAMDHALRWFDAHLAP